MLFFQKAIKTIQNKKKSLKSKSSSHSCSFQPISCQFMLQLPHTKQHPCTFRAQSLTCSNTRCIFPSISKETCENESNYSSLRKVKSCFNSSFTLQMNHADEWDESSFQLLFRDLLLVDRLKADWFHLPASNARR